MRKFLTLAVLALVSAPMLLAVGCSSNGGNQPYSLTGSTSEQSVADHEQWRQRLMYTDEKGHYRPDLAAQGRSLRYVAP